MIFEYAIEPEVVTSWCNIKDCRYYSEKFGLGTGRLVSRFPRSWPKDVLELYRGSNDIERKRLQELLFILSENMINRDDYNWDNNASWIVNAINEHKRIDFHAIIINTNKINHECVISNIEYEQNKSRLWNVSKTVAVNRNPEEMAYLISSFLRCSAVILFIDPYFRPNINRHYETFRRFVEEAFVKKQTIKTKRIEIHVSTKCKIRNFKILCEAGFKNMLPGKKINIKYIIRSEKHNGEKLHNRYILSDIGGIEFCTGLDKGREGQTDDVILLDKELYNKRWMQYNCGKKVFNIVEQGYIKC